MASFVAQARAAALGFSLVLAGGASAYETEWLTEGRDPRNRINLAILGDGYTADAASQQKLTADAKRLLDTLFSLSPYRELRPLFTALLIHVVSNETGADDGTIPGPRDTALGAHYFCGGTERHLCVDPRVTEQVAAQHFPGYTLGLVLVNDPKHGGAGGGGPLAVATYAEPMTMVHEMAHSFAGLADEYDGAGVACLPPDCPEPNVTIRTRREDIKWKAWIEEATPIPTPSRSSTVVGLFKGARFSPDVYRPTWNGCLMRADFAGFCPVCAEALVRETLSRLDLVDGTVPAAGAPVALTTCQPLALSITEGPVAAGDYSATWEIDGVPQPETRLGLSRAPGALARGTHTVAAALTYATPLVRTDPSGALRRRWTWTVDVGDCAGVSVAPALAAVPPGGSETFSASGGAGPYEFSFAANRSGGSIAGAAYTAGRRGNVTDVVRVADAAGNVTLVNVDVGKGVSIAPGDGAVASGARIQFAASGGSGTGYAWSFGANASGATLAADSGLYTAGTRGGIDTVRATDSLGNTASANVTVTASPGPPGGGGCSSSSAAPVPLLGAILAFAGLLRKRSIRSGLRRTGSG